MANHWTVRGSGPALAAVPSDATLIEHIRHGDRDSFAVIIRRHNQRLFRVARSIVGSDSEAEDVVQHAYLSAYVNLHQFAADSAFSTWLTRIAINEALARLKNAGRVQRFTDEGQLPDWWAGTAALASPEDDLSRRELATLLEAAIDELPESCRVTLILREIEGLTTAEAAACLSITEEAVRARLHRARALLRHELAHRVGATEVWSFAGERCLRLTSKVLAAIGPPLARPETQAACR